MPTPALDILLQHPGIWRGRASGPVAPDALRPSGYAALDRLLRGGWPQGQLIELAGSPFGCGETRLLLPLMHACTQAQRPVILVAPPALPWIPGWLQLGIDPRYLLLIRAENDPDTLWSSEQILQHPGAGAVLLWLRTSSGEALRRLRLAVSQSDSHAVVLRPRSALQQASAAHLRIGWRAIQDQLQLSLLKQTGGWPAGQDIRLPRLPPLVRPRS